jgi:hypothetical protein
VFLLFNLSIPADVAHKPEMETLTPAFHVIVGIYSHFLLPFETTFPELQTVSLNRSYDSDTRRIFERAMNTHTIYTVPIIY